MYKLVCIDMDGTLLNDDKEISERNKLAIKEADKMGVKIAISTGRPFSSADIYSDIIGLNTPIITANGAYIRDKRTDEVIYKSLLGIENCKAILKILNDLNIAVYFHGPNYIIVDDLKKVSKAYLKMNENIPVEKQTKIIEAKNWDEIFTKYEDELLKCIAIDEDRDKISKAKTELKDKVKNIEVVSSYYNNFEIMGKGVSKGHAAGVLAAYYGIDQDEVICIGDNENDLSMIKYAGLGVAMGNAADIVKESAGFITDSNNNDGVAKAIEKFVLNLQK